MYKKLFEASFLAETERYYKHESEAFFNNSASSVIDYVKKALIRFEQEKKRVRQYLSESTLEQVLKTCGKTLIECRGEKLAREFDRLIGLDARDDLALLYQLVSQNLTVMEQLKCRFESCIYMQGLNATKICCETADTVDPTVYVHTILSVQQKFTSLMSQSFGNDPEFVSAFERALRKCINTNTTTSSKPAVSSLDTNSSNASMAIASSNPPELNAQAAVPDDQGAPPQVRQTTSQHLEQQLTGNGVVRNVSSKSAELLAKFCHLVLQKDNKISHIGEMESTLANVVCCNMLSVAIDL